MQRGLPSSPLKLSEKHMWSDLPSSLQLCYSARRVLDFRKENSVSSRFCSQIFFSNKKFSKYHFCAPHTSTTPKKRGFRLWDKTAGLRGYMPPSVMIKNRKRFPYVCSQAISYCTIKTEDTGTELLIPPLMYPRLSRVVLSGLSRLLDFSSLPALPGMKAW